MQATKTVFKAAAIFSSNMVLQREKAITIWGKGENGRIVTAEVAGNTAKAVVTDGKWEISLAPMNAGGPYELFLSDSKDTITFSNIMLGEVWLAGGQSNMEFELQNCNGGKEILESAKNVNVRFYYTKKIAYFDDDFDAKETDSGWEVFGDEGTKYWSAVGFFAASKISQQLGVTVGVIGCNWGGTSATAWMSREFIEMDRDTKIYMDEYDEALGTRSMEELKVEWDEYQAYSKAWNEKVAEIYTENPNTGWTEALEIAGENRYPGPKNPYNEFRPAGLYETMLRRVCPYTLRGFWFYQGESDDHRPNSYYKLFSNMISQWRKDWGDEELPMIFVQLPMFKYQDDIDHKHWAKIREGQTRVYKTVRNAYMAVIVEHGTVNDIHPTEKQPVGERIALLALGAVYGTDAACFAPELDYYYVRESGIVLAIKHTYGGIEVRGESAVGFELAGADNQYCPADKVEIVGNEVFISSERVEYPRYARYNFTNHGPVTVYNRVGLPMGGFRTSMEDEG